MKYLVTGAAGFIGAGLSERLLERGGEVVGLDSMNDYYDVRLKESRLERLKSRPGFRFVRMDLADREAVSELFSGERFDMVANMAAQAGVRYSLENPMAYVDSNMTGFAHVLEGCRHTEVRHLVYASSSSVYGANRKVPFSVHDNVDHPVSLYAASKKANELMAHAYSHLFGLPATGLRFFTVYGPMGRPDMAYFMFTRALFEGQPIKVFNFGEMRRDFTYIDDILEAVVRVLDRPPAGNPDWSAEKPDTATSRAPYRLYNIGNNRPENIMRFIHILEDLTGRKAEKIMMPMQPGDVEETFADVDDLVRDVGFKPSTSIEEGLARFVDWYREYYKV